MVTAGLLPSYKARNFANTVWGLGALGDAESSLLPRLLDGCMVRMTTTSSTADNTAVIATVGAPIAPASLQYVKEDCRLCISPSWRSDVTTTQSKYASSPAGSQWHTHVPTEQASTRALRR